MDFLEVAPSTWNTLWQTIDFVRLFDDLAQVARLVERLLDVLPVEVSGTIHNPSQISIVLLESMHLFQLHYANKLLVKLTGAVVDTTKRCHVSLENHVVLSYLRV